ncbi:MAG: hypothetical protein J7K00_01470 [Candidatus Diapherotrites archaeon]|nr:hypothetical protein [Candidatus Diapherotrites archaeon]
MEAKVFIQGVFSITGAGPVVVGKVVDGMLTPGMKLEISGTTMQVRSIEQHHEALTRAGPGENVGIGFTNGNKDLLKSVEKQEVTFFSDDSASKGFNGQVPEPNRPKGVIDSLKGLFGK